MAAFSQHNLGNSLSRLTQLDFAADNRAHIDGDRVGLEHHFSRLKFLADNEATAFHPKAVYGSLQQLAGGRAAYGYCNRIATRKTDVGAIE